MPIYYSADERLFDEIEFQQRASSKLKMAAPTFLQGDEVVPFVDIEYGKPLAVEIRYIWTGEHPKKEWNDSTKDMLVTSAMRSIAPFKAEPRAINFLLKQVRRYSGVANVPATEDGTPLVYYSPAVDKPNSVMTFEFGFRDFDPKLINLVGNAFKVAAGVPVFASAAGNLLLGQSVLKLAADAGKLLLEKDAVFKATEAVQFLRPGAEKTKAGFRLITQTEAEGAALKKTFHIDDSGKLVDANGAQYSGNTPYMIISLDGRANDDYKKFAPTLASAALLEDFFAIREEGVAELEVFKKALELHNDYKYRQKADDLLKDLKAIESEQGKDSQAYKDKEKQYKAALANILNPELKPK